MYYENLFSKLEEQHIKYLVVGGLAVNLHGVPRMTADVDIAIAFDAGNVQALIVLLEELGYKPRVPVDPALLGDPSTRATWQADKHMRAFSFLNHANPLEELDVMLDTPFDFMEAYGRRQVIAAGSLNVNVASLDDLIATKQGTEPKRGFTYTVTEEQVRLYMAVPAEAKLNWLAEANGFLSKALTGKRREIWQKFRRGEI